ncbi:MAG: ABC transporter substrate-binding protein [Dehalococcoidia bacterium]
MHRLRSATVLLSLAVFVLAAAACASQSQAPPDSGAVAEATPEPTTITWSYWGDDWEVAVNHRVARAFESEHPDIKVRQEHHPWPDYFTWLRGEWREGRSPDVMFLNYIPAYVAMGELAPLDGFLGASPDALADFYPALLDGFRANGQLYGLPRDNDPKVIYYNRDHFRDAALPEPSAGWTWEDLRRTALALTDRTASEPRYGFGFERDSWWLVWLWQNGGDVVNDPMHPTAVRLDSPANAAALQFLQDLINSDGVTPPPDQLTTEAMSALFRQGRLSMMFGNHALVPQLANTPNLSWDVAPLPVGRMPANVAGGAGFTISKRSPNKDAAWKLVEFLAGHQAQAIFAESGLITPARRSVRENSIFLRQQPYHAGVFVAETEFGRAMPNFPGVTEMFRIIDEALRPVWRGERSVAEVLRELAPRIEETIGIAGS